MRRSVLALALLLPACAGPAGEDRAGPSSSAASSSPTPTAAALDGCPAAFPLLPGDVWVPAPPSTGTPGRLVPDADPVEALLCRYRGVAPERQDGETALEGQVRLTDGLDRIRTDLLVPAQLPGQDRACTLIGAPRSPHLLRLRYADGELWVSATQEVNRCTGTGNGAFLSSAYLGDRLAEAYDARAWRPAGAASEPCRGGPGRAGQERALVPDGWTALVVCEQDAARGVDPSWAAQVAGLLGEVATRPDTGGCSGEAGAERQLVFRYAAGPDVVVTWLPGCEPSLMNGSLSAALTPAQTELLGVLLER